MLFSSSSVPTPGHRLGKAAIHSWPQASNMAQLAQSTFSWTSPQLCHGGEEKGEPALGAEVGAPDSHMEALTPGPSCSLQVS